MPRRTTAGNLQVNLTLDPEAYSLICKHATTKKDYGRFLSRLVRDFAQSRQRQDLEERLERLETQVEELATR